MSREIGYLFKPELRDKIRRNLKWQTRRLRGLEAINENPEMWKSAHQDGKGDWIFWTTDEPGLEQFTKEQYPSGNGIKCPFGTHGDRMYVKEPTRVVCFSTIGGQALVEWIDDGHKGWVNVTEQDLQKIKGRDDASKQSSAMFMLRSFARTKRSLVSVRPVILQEISEEDAIGEGIESVCVGGGIKYKDYSIGTFSLYSPISSFRTLWDSINKDHQWSDRPWWVWRSEWAKEVSE